VRQYWVSRRALDARPSTNSSTVNNGDSVPHLDFGEGQVALPQDRKLLPQCQVFQHQVALFVAGSAEL
jgi:hypothetical protein